MVREAGLDLPCGAGRLGLQGAPGALPRALGFNSLIWVTEKTEPPPVAGVLFFGGEVGI